MGQVDVCLTGKLLESTNAEEALAQFVHLTGVTREQAEQLLQSGKERVVKRGVSENVGEQYRKTFTAIGVEVILRPVAGEAAPAVAAVLSTPQPPAALTAAPAPFERPAAVVKPAERMSVEDEVTEQESGWEVPAILMARKVPASHGWLWIKEGADLYMEAFVPWTGMALCFSVIMLLVSKIPRIGLVFTTLLSPLFIGGMVLAAHRQQSSRPRVADLFEGLKTNALELNKLGAIQALVSIPVGIALFAVSRSMVFLISGGMASPRAFLTHLFLHPVSLILMFLVIFICGMAFWLTPSLVAVGDMTAKESVKECWSALSRNWSAFLVCGVLIALAYVILGMLPIYLLSLVLFVLVRVLLHVIAPAIVLKVLFIITLLSPLLLAPFVGLFTITNYTAFRDIYSSRS